MTQEERVKPEEIDKPFEGEQTKKRTRHDIRAKRRLKKRLMAMRPFARMFFSGWHDKAWNALDYTVRTGKPGFDHAFGKQAFEWMEENPEARTRLDQGQGLKAIGLAKAVMDAYDFAEFSSICDLGGGQGSFLIQLLANWNQSLIFPLRNCLI